MDLYCARKCNVVEFVLVSLVNAVIPREWSQAML